MPPRRRSDRLQMRVSGENLLITEEKLTASRHLTHQFLSMSRELGREISCPICLWVPQGEAIERGMVVRLCGHVSCAVCLLCQMDTDDTLCSVCRV